MGKQNTPLNEPETQETSPAAEKKGKLPIRILDGKYELNREPGIVNLGIGTVDLNNLSVPMADRLIQIGCKWISKV